MTLTLIFDNTPLSHFARAGRLKTLEALGKGYRCITPAQVANELQKGMVEHPSLARVISASWLEVVELRKIEEVAAFARYKAELGGGTDKNNGEAAVLAWTSINGGTAVVDERAGSRIAHRDGMDVHGTLWLVVNGVRSGELTSTDAQLIVDELAATDMALPVDGAGLLAWAYDEELLP